MSVKALDLRPGMGVKWRDDIWVAVKVDHVVKGKGGSLMQIQLRNVLTDQIVPQRFGVNDKFETIFFDRKKMSYLYTEQTAHILMDENYEQVELPKDLIGDKEVYLTDNMEIEVSFVEGRPVSAEIPNSVELTVVDTPPQVKGATATNQYKDAICEGGAKVKVPPFVENETVIKVDTRTGEYLGRV